MIRRIFKTLVNSMMEIVSFLLFMVVIIISSILLLATGKLKFLMQ